jgi:hypothetical protein
MLGISRKGRAGSIFQFERSTFCPNRYALLALWDKFDSFMSLRPTTSRPRDIPAETIRQQQTDLSPHISLSNSLRGCGAPFSEELSQVDRDTLLCLASRQLDANLGKKLICVRHYKSISGSSKQDALRVAIIASPSLANRPQKKSSLHEVSHRAERSTWSRHHDRLLFLAGITERREVVGHGD